MTAALLHNMSPDGSTAYEALDDLGLSLRADEKTLDRFLSRLSWLSQEERAQLESAAYTLCSLLDERLTTDEERLAFAVAADLGLQAIAGAAGAFPCTCPFGRCDCAADLAREGGAA